MILGIYGSMGLGREIYEIVVRINIRTPLWKRIFFIDDVNPEGEHFGTERMQFNTLIKNRSNYEPLECIVAVGEPSIREKLYNKLVNEHIKITTLIDPSSIISPTAIINDGAIICEFVTIHTGVVVCNNVLVQPFCDIGHDIKIGEHTVIGPHCAPGGNSVFGKRVYAGMQSTLKENLTIGDDAIIAMGSSVFQNVPIGVTVIGNPARITRGNDEHKIFHSR